MNNTPCDSEFRVRTNGTKEIGLTLLIPTLIPARVRWFAIAVASSVQSTSSSRHVGTVIGVIGIRSWIMSEAISKSDMPSSLPSSWWRQRDVDDRLPIFLTKWTAYDSDSFSVGKFGVRVNKECNAVSFNVQQALSNKQWWAACHDVTTRFSYSHFSCSSWFATCLTACHVIAHTKDRYSIALPVMGIKYETHRNRSSARFLNY